MLRKLFEKTYLVKLYKNFTNATTSKFRPDQASRSGSLVTFRVVAGGGAFYFLYNVLLRHQNPNASPKKRLNEEIFLRFASVEYKGQVYMTPRDFLDSVSEINPRIKQKRRTILTEQYVNNILEKTPPQKKGSSRFFRELGTNGIISYTDYLFLLSIITKPHSSFKITFKMLDINDNRKIDKEEYYVMERIFSRHWKVQRGVTKPVETSLKEEELVDDESGLQTKNRINSSVITHLFGQKGKDTLSYKAFKKFLLHVQREIFELEFSNFSNGQPVINKVDFAKLLIKYTSLDEDYDFDDYIERLQETTRGGKIDSGITFEEFVAFIEFLHRLEDFTFAVKYYAALTGHSSKIDFHDAFRIVGGHNLSPDLLDTIFIIFDVNGTGLVSLQDFVRTTEERLYRGFRRRFKKNKWRKFKTCIRRSGEWQIVFYRKENGVKIREES